MKPKIEIDARYLGGNELARFLKIRESVEAGYRKALSSLTIGIPYVPRLYIIPFLKRIVSEGMQKFVWNSLGNDPWEPPKFAIFPSLPFLERASEKHVTTSLAHELAHLLDLAKTPSLPKKMKGKSLRKADLEIHERMPSLFQSFKEPLRSWLQAWEPTSKDPEFTRTITMNAAYRTFTSHEQITRYLKSKSQPFLV